ncbi:MAG: type II toxin-antitoxin system VapC family toxin [Sphaerospermopsis kisseleviana]|uniref:type II toxin-antitoxin system VapC family toxin n=1 Tax=Sphaerospermopsis sp. LEGE 08334 TaxID=1828651 RepID=UPI001882C49A|nr:PIN domain-containing protein [Sphaerospermopsis sp. LEGE 08334]MBE9056993.1 PIN domain-containing protein [Sphaerospermopsis sp. LEGE 08334]
MKKSSKPRHYWDSCTFLAVLKNESDKINECLSVIKAAEAGEIIIVTSALTFIEVIRLEKGKPKLSKDVEEKIRSFFRHEWIYVYDVDRKIGELARDLMWQYESLKPKDATHVATAIQAKVDVLDTFDDGLLKLSGLIGDPLLPIKRPYWPNQLELELFDEI